jgi:hypothetical protein
VITEAAFLIARTPASRTPPASTPNRCRWGNPAQLARVHHLQRGLRRRAAGLFRRHRCWASSIASGQDYLVSSTNFCDQGISGGPLVDAEGRLVGLTSGGPRDKQILCLSLTAETARRVLDQTLIAIDGFPTDYLTNLRRRW